ncbi:hypothetical protein ES703_54233 [subsurface metagenome]
MFRDSLRVIVGYEVIDSISNQCGTGLLVYLTCFEIIEEPDCYARFESYPLDILMSDSNKMVGYHYAFVDVSQGNVVERYWFIDGDSISSDSIITYSFHNPGEHTVCLAINTSDGCHDVCCEAIYIGEPPDCRAFFEYERILYTIDSTASDPDLVAAYLYQFYDRSTGYVIDWRWQFGDDIIEGGEDPVYEFPAPGIYEVCLTIQTTDGCTSTYCEQVYVTDDMDCKAMFEYYCPVDTPYYGNDFPGSTLLHFIDLSRGNITHWLWDFGDGTVSEEQNPFHEFPGPGVYKVCLVVSSPDGCEDAYCTEVVIGSPDRCEAYFEYCNYSSIIEDVYYEPDVFVVGFKNFSTPEPYHSRWEFGDASYSSEKNPVHVYQESGLYDVCLTIYTSEGCTDTYCTTVNVGMVSCKVDFTWELWIPDCSDYTIAHLFFPDLEEDAWSYYWDFGDGSFSTDPVTAYIYTNEGSYNVCLDVYYKNNCAARTCKTIHVSWVGNDSIFDSKCNPSGVTNIQSEEELSVLKVFPNPASDRMVVDLFSNADRQLTVQLIDMTGRTVKMKQNYKATAGNNQLVLPLYNIETGIYIYLISSSEKVLRGRISIIK